MESIVQFFTPPLPVTLSLICCVSIFFFLILFSHRPVRLEEEKRFQGAAAAALILWIVLLVAFDIFSSFDLDVFWNLLSGFLIFLGAIIVWWTFWTQIAWGFRLTMLVNLAGKEYPVTIEEWMSEYGGGKGGDALLDSRLQMLIRLGWARRTEDAMVLVPGIGSTSGKLVAFFRSVFAIEEGS